MLNKRMIIPKKVSRPTKAEEEKILELEEAKKKFVPTVALPTKGKKIPELLRGFRDILPDEQPYWDFFRDTARSLAESYGFERIELPILEKEELFIRTVGKQTDIVEKEIYTFEDKG